MAVKVLLNWNSMQPFANDVTLPVIKIGSLPLTLTCVTIHVECCLTTSSSISLYNSKNHTTNASFVYRSLQLDWSVQYVLLTMFRIECTWTTACHLSVNIPVISYKHKPYSCIKHYSRACAIFLHHPTTSGNLSVYLNDEFDESELWLRVRAS